MEWNMPLLGFLAVAVIVAGPFFVAAIPRNWWWWK